MSQVENKAKFRGYFKSIRGIHHNPLTEEPTYAFVLKDAKGRIARVATFTATERQRLEDMKAKMNIAKKHSMADVVSDGADSLSSWMTYIDLYK